VTSGISGNIKESAMDGGGGKKQLERRSRLNGSYDGKGRRGGAVNLKSRFVCRGEQGNKGGEATQPEFAQPVHGMSTRGSLIPYTRRPKQV